MQLSATPATQHNSRNSTQLTQLMQILQLNKTRQFYAACYSLLDHIFHDFHISQDVLVALQRMMKIVKHGTCCEQSEMQLF